MFLWKKVSAYSFKLQTKIIVSYKPRWIALFILYGAKCARQFSSFIASWRNVSGHLFIPFLAAHLSLLAMCYNTSTKSLTTFRTICIINPLPYFPLVYGSCRPKTTIRCRFNKRPEPAKCMQELDKDCNVWKLHRKTQFPATMLAANKINERPYSVWGLTIHGLSQGEGFLKKH